MNNMDPLRRLLSSPAASKNIYGVVIGIVTNNQDPDGLGRIKVKFPWLSDEDESHWARIATPMAGNERGLYYLPEVDDEVLMAFEHGQVDFPYVVGCLWNGKDKPPEDNGDGENNLRTIKSRSGHVIRLDDTDGAEKIEIIDKSASNSFVIDTSSNAITIMADGDITLESASGNVIIKGQSVEIEATAADVKAKSSANMELEAGGQCNVSGSVINLN